MTPKAQTNFLDEIIVDCFAGGGGWSWGIEQATGSPVEIAINHDPDAILMHKTNHPFTRHYCENIYDVDPRKAVQGRAVGWAHFSPDCKHFSKAKGGKPVDKRIRGLAWVILKWASKVRPRIISMENVEEIQTWGPLVALRDKQTGRVIKGYATLRVWNEHDKEYEEKTVPVVAKKGEVVPASMQIFVPDKKRAGQTFKKFIAALKSLGYTVEWRELRACDYGAPTIRKRFFLLARCDGQPIVWPQPTHGDPKSEAVQSGKLLPWRTAAEIIDWGILCPSIFERKRPLAENTLRRIARGIQKFVVDNPDPFIVKFQQHSTGQPMDRPLDTVMPGAARFGVVTPVITAIGQTGFSGDRAHSATEPVRTLVSKAEQCLVVPSLIQYHSEKSAGEVRGQAATQPVQTVDTSNRHALVAPTLVQVGYGEAPGQAPRAPGLQKPLGTVVNTEKHAVVSAFLAKHYGGAYTGAGSDMDEPLHTVTATDHNALVSTHIMKMKGTNIGQTVDAPLHTITAGGKHFAEVQAFLVKYYGQGTGQAVNKPLDTITANDRFGLVTLHGVDYQIVDIGMRMLTPRELYNAQGFPPDYVIDRDYTGKAYPKSKQVARCGNAVPPPFARALVRANWPERCAGIELETVREFSAHAAV